MATSCTCGWIPTVVTVSMSAAARSIPSTSVAGWRGNSNRRREPQEGRREVEAAASPATAKPTHRSREESAHEVPDDPIELVRILHEHEVISALVLLEDLDPRPPDLLLDPHLRLPGHDARPAPDHQRGQRDARDGT